MATQSFPSPDLSAEQTALNSKRGSSRDHENNAASVAKRLSSELMSLMMSPPAGISAFPESDSDLTYWVGRMDGPDGTPYAGQTYSISLSFPQQYPYKPPQILFTSTCYHPNVDLHGNICLDILKEKWSPMLSVSTILISLQSLLGEPNNRSPLNVEAADLWDDEKAFKAELIKHYKPLEDE